MKTPRSTFYVLDELRRPVPLDDVLSLSVWQTENPDRFRVAEDSTGLHRVSTVFLFIDHQHGDGPPLLFETMVFDEQGNDVDCIRYASWEDAETGHKTALRRWRKIEADAMATGKAALDQTVTGGDP